MSDLITDAMVETAADALHELRCLCVMAGESCRCYRHEGDADHMQTRAALEAAAPAIAAKAWEEGYQACRNRPRVDGYLINRANPYQTRADAIERGES